MLKNGFVIPTVLMVPGNSRTNLENELGPMLINNINTSATKIHNDFISHISFLNESNLIDNKFSYKNKNINVRTVQRIVREIKNQFSYSYYEKSPFFIEFLTKSAWPGYLIVYSLKFGTWEIISSECNKVLNPSVKNASNSPIPSTSKFWTSDKASFTMI